MGRNLNRHFSKEDQEAHEKILNITNYSVQFSSVAQSCLTLCDPMNCSTPGLPVHHLLISSDPLKSALRGQGLQAICVLYFLISTYLKIFAIKLGTQN